MLYWAILNGAQTIAGRLTEESSFDLAASVRIYCGLHDGQLRVKRCWCRLITESIAQVTARQGQGLHLLLHLQGSKGIEEQQACTLAAYRGLFHLLIYVVAFVFWGRFTSYRPLLIYTAS